MHCRRHQVSERLAGAGTCLHDHVRALTDGGGNCIGHLVLTLAPLATHSLDYGIKGIVDITHSQAVRSSLASISGTRACNREPVSPCSTLMTSPLA